MQKHARPSGTQNDFHFARRGFTRIELQNCLTRGFLCEILGSFFPEEEVESDAAATAGTAASGLLLGFCDAGGV